MEKKRTHSVTLRFTQEEYDWILKNDAGNNVSQFIRRRLFSYGAPAKRQAEATAVRIKKKLTDASQELSRLLFLLMLSNDSDTPFDPKSDSTY